MDAPQNTPDMQIDLNQVIRNLQAAHAVAMAQRDLEIAQLTTALQQLMGDRSTPEDIEAGSLQPSG